VKRDFDLIVHGATGYTGRLIADDAKAAALTCQSQKRELERTSII